MCVKGECMCVKKTIYVCERVRMNYVLYRPSYITIYDHISVIVDNRLKVLLVKY